MSLRRISEFAVPVQQPPRVDFAQALDEISGFHPDDLAQAMARHCADGMERGEDEYLGCPDTVTVDLTAALLAAEAMAPECCVIPVVLTHSAKIAHPRGHDDRPVFSFRLDRVHIATDTLLATYAVAVNETRSRLSLEQAMERIERKRGQIKSWGPGQ